MTQLKNLHFFVIGLAMFSMFFGSGNLIFPLHLGQMAESNWMTAYFGFLMTAVIMPFFGVIAMALYRGNYEHFFGILGKKAGFFVIMLILTVWIPLGSGPRCIVLAHASLASHSALTPPLWLFSIVYCLIITFIVMRKNRMLELLGKYLTPLLLACLGLIVFQGIFKSSATPLPQDGAKIGATFFLGLKEGYNTMDLISSFFFSASIIAILRRNSNDERGSILKAFKAGIVGVCILGLVYFFMVWIGAIYSGELEGVRKDQLLVHIAKLVLGGPLGFVAALAVMLACMTTSVALLNVYADFIADYLFKDRNKEGLGILITQVASYVMSLAGLSGITSLTQPIFQVLYPTLFVLIIINIGRQLVKNRKVHLLAQE